MKEIQYENTYATKVFQLWSIKIVLYLRIKDTGVVVARVTHAIKHLTRNWKIFVVWLSIRLKIPTDYLKKTIEERRMFAYLYNFKQSDVKGLLRCLQKQIWLENVKKVTLTYHPLESWKTGWPKCAEHYLDDGCGIS